MKDLISINDLTKKEILNIFRIADKLYKKRTNDLKGKTVILYFEKPSTRTRVSFEVGVKQLGGHPLFLKAGNLQIKRGELVSDVAKVFDRYAHGMMARTYSHNTITGFAKHARIPVINGLSDKSHPCQVLADLYTVKKKRKTLNLKYCWVGDGNNVCNSWIAAANKLGFEFNVSVPKGYEPSENMKKNVKLVKDPHRAVKNADIIITDTWVSMGDEKEAKKRLKIFKKYQVNKGLVKFAKKNYNFMHCLPVHRGYEVTADIIDGKHSIVWDEAENRLHVQKAIMYLLMK